MQHMPASTMQNNSFANGPSGRRQSRFFQQIAAIGILLLNVSVFAQIPEGRWGHSAVWTGSEMIVWGGVVPSGATQTGAKYNPANDAWIPISTNGAPIARFDHRAVWTGSNMIVWGGQTNSSPNNIDYETGGIYDPQTDSWTSLPMAGVPLRRHGHTAIWTGTQMSVWGGRYETNTVTNTWLNSGGILVPSTSSWTGMASNTAPLARASHSAVWADNLTSMIVWGGIGFSDSGLNSGGVYAFANDTWNATPTLGAPSGRNSHSAIWTGSEMIVWGGNNNLGPPNYSTNDGARLNPISLTWTPTTQLNAPQPRYQHVAVWTGTEMIIWGGINSTFVNTGGRYNPNANSWAPTPTTAGVPKARTAHTAVWTGTEMIIFGGSGTKAFYQNTIGRYNPSSNAWVNSPPKCSLGSPSNNTVVFPPNTLALNATASDNNGSIAQVQFYLDGNTLIGSSTGPVYSVTWSNIPPGSHTINARAIDDLGAVTSSTTNTVLVAGPPTVSLISPTNTFSILGPTNILLLATAATSVGSINSVDFFSGTSQLGTTNVLPYSLNSATLAPGNYSFTAVASNSIGLLTTSAPVAVYVLTEPKVVEFSSPLLSGGDAQYSIQGIAGQTYIVDATTNLGSPNTIWVPIATNVAPSNTFFFTDPDATNFNRRFYRWRQ